MFMKLFPRKRCWRQSALWAAHGGTPQLGWLATEYPSIEWIAYFCSGAHTHAVETLLATAAARHAFGKTQGMCGRESTADSGFLAELSRQLVKIIPFEASFWSATDPLTLLATSPSRI